jgi:hypothetical protein
VTNPYCPDIPVYIASISESETFSGEQYRRFFDDTIKRLLDVNMVVCGVVIDNLSAQTTVLKEAIILAEEDLHDPPHQASNSTPPV